MGEKRSDREEIRKRRDQKEKRSEREERRESSVIAAGQAFNQNWDVMKGVAELRRRWNGASVLNGRHHFVGSALHRSGTGTFPRTRIQVRKTLARTRAIPSEQITEFEPVVRGQDIAVFAAGVVPFVWATGEFWRRVLRGEVFGTGRDSVRIDNPFDESEGGAGRSSGGRKLTKSALNVAALLFAIAGGSLLLALVAFLQAGN